MKCPSLTVTSEFDVGKCAFRATALRCRHVVSLSETENALFPVLQETQGNKLLVNARIEWYPLFEELHKNPEKLDQTIQLDLGRHVLTLTLLV